MQLYESQDSLRFNQLYGENDLKTPAWLTLLICSAQRTSLLLQSWLGGSCKLASSISPATHSLHSWVLHVDLGLILYTGIWSLLYHSNQTASMEKTMEPTIHTLITWPSSSEGVDILICHTTVCRNAINFQYNHGHVTLWCLEVVPLVYVRMINKLWTFLILPQAAQFDMHSTLLMTLAL